MELGSAELEQETHKPHLKQIELKNCLKSTIGVLKIAIVIVGCHILIVNDSDSFGHP
jgi:hypothetical protein